MAALSAQKHNPVIRELAARLQAAGQTAKVILTACRRKRLVILNDKQREQHSWRLMPHPTLVC